MGQQAYRNTKLRHLLMCLQGLISQAIVHAGLQQCVVGHSVWLQTHLLQHLEPAVMRAESGTVCSPNANN